jgi:hypothetical protein
MLSLMIAPPPPTGSPEPLPAPLLAGSELSISPASEPAAPGAASWRRRGLLTGAVALLLVGAGVAVVAWWPSGSSPQAIAAAPSAGPPEFAAMPTVLPRPKAGAPGPERHAWATQEIKAMLRQQDTSLMAGEFAQFAASAVPGDKAAAAALRRRFDNLRALSVTRFDQRLEGSIRLKDVKRGRWQAVVAVSLCIVEADCAPDTAVFDTLWRETAEGLTFTGYATHDPEQTCGLACPLDLPMLVRPWETTDLAVQIGARVLVAVPARHRDRLPDLTRRAETAAAWADRYAIGDTPVHRYRVFVADDAAWRQWYTGFPGRWVAGQAVPTGTNGVEVGVLLSELSAGRADRLLRHELAHVATLRSSTFYGANEVWWLVEGMAEYVEHGAGAGGYDNRAALRDFLRQRTLRSVAVRPPARSASATAAVARYAVGYYALNYLMSTYGKAKTLQFFQQAVQYGLGLDTAARAAFGKPWSKIDKACAAAVRKA